MASRSDLNQFCNNRNVDKDSFMVERQDGDNDIESADIHSQLQIQLYLEELEQAEVAAQDSLQVEAAVQASLHQLDHPEQSHEHLPVWSTSVFDQPGLTVTEEAVLANMSLLSLAVAASAGAGLGGGIGQEVAFSQALGTGHVDPDYHIEEDDEDEECLPPSETKYILYDDHVSPVGIPEALAMLNGNLMDVLLPVDGHQETSTMTTDLVSQQEGGRNTVEHLSEETAAATPLHVIQKEYQEFMWAKKVQTQKIEYPQDVTSEFETESPPSPSDERQHCSLSDMDDMVNLQGRLSHHAGPDISLNLAGNVLSPITIHDLFFSRYYACLVYLNLWDTNLGTWGAQAVGGLMADSACRIQYLNMGRNHLGFEGIVQLSGLYKNSSLVELDLSENHLGPKAAHSLQQIMVRLKKDKACNIRRLNLSNNDINDVGCISIAKIILGTVLSHLDLSFNRISDWGASTILAAFESNDLALKDINMEANPLSFAGGVDLCKILALPRSKITHLDLRGAKVTDVGIPYVAEALRSHNCPIVSLNLYDCQLTDTGIAKIAIKLSVNKSLRVLGLGCNCIGDMGMLALSQGLLLNSTLEELDLSQNDSPLSRQGLEALMSTLRTNTSLLDLRLEVDRHVHDLTRDGRYGASVGTGDEPSGYMDGESDFQYLFQQPLLPSHHPLGLSLNEQQQQASTYIQEMSAGYIDHLGSSLASLQPQSPVPLSQPQAQETEEVPSSTTHATVAQSMQTEIFALSPTAPLIGSAPNQGMTPQVIPTGNIAGPGTAPAALEAAIGIPVAMTEQETEYERQQLALALSSLRAYVRHNFKRTEKLHRLCFEILAMSRVFLFAKDVVEPDRSGALAEEPELQSSPLLSMLRRDCGQNETNPMTLNPAPLTPSGTPTLPASWSSDASVSSPTQKSATAVPLIEDSTESMLFTLSQKPRGTLALLPFEIKEMILRRLDREGLMSERQFQTVMNYAGACWETQREPWERWGEIRELILENTRCYYYEP
ncbi:NACHT, LRR and PYD domains-containing protein 14 [Gryganskiella cystojenkinii]|nr:NACHT, LRR and PYD domains-containing protein 14 [Gryganskiella cystojenkinii]